METTQTVCAARSAGPAAPAPARADRAAPRWCSRSDCAGCALDGKLTCRQGIRDIVDFMAPATTYFVPFAGGMMATGHWQAMIVWGVLAAVFFLYVQQKMVCSRCPHYAGPAPVLTCHAAFGLPKLPRYNPRPLGRAGLVFFLAYLGMLFLYPFPFLALAGQWLWLAVTGCALFSWVWFVGRRLCTQCVNRFCPFNRLPRPVRAMLDEVNPV